jgi:hypothetical protein
MQTLYTTIQLRSNKSTIEGFSSKLPLRSIIRLSHKHEYCSILHPKCVYSVLVTKHQPLALTSMINKHTHVAT